MKAIAHLSAGLAALLALLLPAAPAHAIPRTWVASNGAGGACTRAAPCADFQTAHNTTDAGGEINCVDAGLYGSVTISKSITIDCTGIFAGVRPPGPGTAAIFLNMGSDVVTLRGLAIDGGGTGGIGVSFAFGTALHIENCRIFGFRGGVNGRGISVTPGAGVTSKLSVSDSVVTENGLPADGGGIIVQPSGSGSARVELDRVRVKSNTHGIVATGTGSTGPIVIQVRDSLVAGHTGNGIAAITNVGIVVDRTSSVGNAGSGILAQGSGAVVNIGSSTVVGNAAGFNAAAGGQILSYQNNQASGNVIDGAVTAVLTVK
jgi:hypothetical protein